jgi:hypothetical protein
MADVQQVETTVGKHNGLTIAAVLFNYRQQRLQCVDLASAHMPDHLNPQFCEIAENTSVRGPFITARLGLAKVAEPSAHSLNSVITAASNSSTLTVAVPRFITTIPPAKFASFAAS